MHPIFIWEYIWVVVLFQSASYIHLTKKSLNLLPRSFKDHHLSQLIQLLMHSNFSEEVTHMSYKFAYYIITYGSNDACISRVFLQLVNLRTTMPFRLLPEVFSETCFFIYFPIGFALLRILFLLLQCLSNNKRAALTEIVDVLRSVCHAHRLPLALTWIPCFYTEGTRNETTRIQIK
jgi:hypothetical protein